MTIQSTNIISNATVADSRNLPVNRWYRRHAYAPEINDAVLL